MLKCYNLKARITVSGHSGMPQYIFQKGQSLGFGFTYRLRFVGAGFTYAFYQSLCPGSFPELMQRIGLFSQLRD